MGYEIKVDGGFRLERGRSVMLVINKYACTCFADRACIFVSRRIIPILLALPR